MEARPGERVAAMSDPIPLKQVLLRQATATYDVTGRLLALVSDDDLAWRPAGGRNWMTVGQLLMHCAAYGCGRAVAGFVTGDWGAAAGETESGEDVPPAAALPGVASVAEARTLLAEDRRLTLRCLAEVEESALLRPAPAPPWGGPPRSLLEQLLLMIAHLAQHKGQLFYYLKLMGREVGTAELWGE